MFIMLGIILKPVFCVFCYGLLFIIIIIIIIIVGGGNFATPKQTP